MDDKPSAASLDTGFLSRKRGLTRAGPLDPAVRPSLFSRRPSNFHGLTLANIGVGVSDDPAELTRRTNSPTSGASSSTTAGEALEEHGWVGDEQPDAQGTPPDSPHNELFLASEIERSDGVSDSSTDLCTWPRSRVSCLKSPYPVPRAPRSMGSDGGSAHSTSEYGSPGSSEIPTTSEDSDSGEWTMVRAEQDGGRQPLDGPSTDSSSDDIPQEEHVEKGK